MFSRYNAFVYLSVCIFAQTCISKQTSFFLDDKSNSLPFLKLVLKIQLPCTYYSSELIILQFLYVLSKICTNKILLDFYYQLSQHTNVASCNDFLVSESMSIDYSAITAFVILSPAVDTSGKVTDFTIIYAICKHSANFKSTQFISKQYRSEFSLGKQL